MKNIFKDEQVEKMEDDIFLRCIESNMLSDMTLQVKFFFNWL